MGEAIVRLAGKVKVQAHLRKSGNKVVPVVSHTRDPLEGFAVAYKPSPIQGEFLMLGDRRDGRRVGLINFTETPEGLNIDSIAVEPEFRGRGLAVGMVKRLHEDRGQPIVHGSFSSLEGVRFGVFMASRYPSWNKLWTTASPQGVEFWDRYTQLDPESETFDPIDYNKRNRIAAAIRQGVADAAKARKQV